MIFKDAVKIVDRLILSSPLGTVVKRAFDSPNEEIVQIKGFFSIQMRERGKKVPGGSREGYNIWTLTGREYLAQLMSVAAFVPVETYGREDHIYYIGFGTGTTPEVSTVSALVAPVPYDSAGGNFLAKLDLPTYPLSPTKTTVKYSRIFSETELSYASTVSLSEAGLFTDGDPLSNYAPGTRDTTIANAASQSPAAYKTFEPIKKTQNYQMEANWEIRF